jgi:hypothetical protein
MRGTGLSFRYALAILAAALALILRYLLTPLLGNGKSLSHSLARRRFFRVVLRTWPVYRHDRIRNAGCLVLVSPPI